MNLHDKAHDLAKELRNSEEYRIFLAAKQQLDNDETSKKMVKDFMTKKLAAEYDILAGKTEDKTKTEQLQQMYDLIIHNSTARDFLHAHMRFQQVIADIYKIIGDAVAEGMDLFGEE